MKSETRNPKSEIGDPSVSAFEARRFPAFDGGRDYDLLQRTTEFSKQVILFAKRIPTTIVNARLITQLVDASTSVGANYHEADDASSPRDYRHKVCLCRKESKESMFWLHMAAVAEPKLRDEAATLWREARELNLIFGKIVRVCDANTATRKTVPQHPQTPK